MVDSWEYPPTKTEQKLESSSGRRMLLYSVYYGFLYIQKYRLFGERETSLSILSVSICKPSTKFLFYILTAVGLFYLLHFPRSPAQVGERETVVMHRVSETVRSECIYIFVPFFGMQGRVWNRKERNLKPFPCLAALCLFRVPPNRTVQLG